MKSKEKIAEELRKLELILASPTFRKESAFGDDNEANIKADIAFLKGTPLRGMTDAQENSVQVIKDWLDDNEDISPSENYEGLHQVKF